MKKEKRSSYQFEKHLQNMIAMNAGKGLYTSCAGKHGSWYKTNFITIKPVLAFQTLTLATLGKWATTHERVFFLGKNCSWTLLPGSIWLKMPMPWLYQFVQTSESTFWSFKTCWWLTGLLPGSIWLQRPITWLRYISCLRSFRTHFDSLKRADDLRVYQSLMMPLNHQAGIQGTLKFTIFINLSMLKILVDRALMWHISFLFDGISFDAQSIHVLCSHHNNRRKQSVPRFPLYILFSFDFD